MKRLLTAALLALSGVPGVCQVKVFSNNTVGVMSPSAISGIHFAVGQAFSKFYWSNRNPLIINTSSADPRIQSDNKVVFYNLGNTDFIDVQVRTLTEYSDSAAKKDVRPLGTEGESALSKVERLKGVSYQWKRSAAPTRQVGFIAQDVERVLPDVVSTADSTGAKMIAYTHIIPYLVEAIREQQSVIEGLKSQVSGLSATVGKLRGASPASSSSPK